MWPLLRSCVAYMHHTSMVRVWYVYGTCMEQEPKQKITFVLPRQLIEGLRVVAKRHRRSLVSEFVWALEH